MMAYRRFWLKQPPADILIAGYLGYKGDDASKRVEGESTVRGTNKFVESMAEAMGIGLPDGK